MSRITCTKPPNFDEIRTDIICKTQFYNYLRHISYIALQTISFMFLHFSLLGLFLFNLSSCKLEVQPSGEEIPIESIAKLPKELRETSGIARCSDSTYYVHNDSGHKPRLYEISATSGDIKRKVDIKDADNKDWEELAEDSTYIYIGDFGNNEGLRKDLTIYKVNKADLESGDKADAEAIYFDYPNRSTFIFGGKHNFDCEAMIAIGDSLYLFSKNRADLSTDVYRLSKSPGNYIAEHLGRFNSSGLITAADFNASESNRLALLGYKTVGNKYVSFLWLFSDFSNTDFFGGKHQRFEVSPDLQAEAIIFESDTTVLITNEQELKGRGKLYRISLSKEEHQ